MSRMVAAPPRWFVFVPLGRPGAGRWRIPIHVTDRDAYARAIGATHVYCGDDLVTTIK